jgi:dihydroflavonol-4-reductase
MQEIKNVLVTGADGMLGASICRELLQQGYQVKAFILSNSKSSYVLTNLPLAIAYGDVTDYESVLQASDGMDAVIHAAALTTVWPRANSAVNKVNYDGALNIAKAVKHNKLKRFVHIGTASSFGSGSKSHPGAETFAYDSAHYNMDYITSKYNAQCDLLQLHKHEDLPVVIVNPTFMIGPFDSGPSSGKMVMEFYKGKVPGYTTGGKNFVASKDVATAAVNALTKGRTGQCYIAGNANLTYKEFFEKIAEVTSKKRKMFKAPNVLIYAMGITNSLVARLFKIKPQLSYTMSKMALKDQYYSVEKARTELNLPQTPIETAIADCVNWYKEVGYLK